MNDIERLKSIAKNNGTAFFGTADVRDDLPERFKHIPYAISLGMRYPRTIINEIKKAPTISYFHQYRTFNANLDRVAVLLQSHLLNMGHEAVYIPASQSEPNNPFCGAFSHKIAAVKAGLGTVGKNNLFIHKKYGPAVRLITVLTDKVLPVSKITEQNICNTCDKCFKACPAGALFNAMPKPPYATQDVFDAEKCSHYMKNKFKHIGRGSVCGICIAACPYV